MPGPRQRARRWRSCPICACPAPSCQGKRFNPATLEVRYRGLSIADVLEMPIEDARQFFANVPTLQPGLQALDEVGLGYLALGQPASTLSGGEAQRVKLAAELGKTTYRENACISSTSRPPACTSSILRA